MWAVRKACSSRVATKSGYMGLTSVQLPTHDLARAHFLLLTPSEGGEVCSLKRVDPSKVMSEVSLAVASA